MNIFELLSFDFKEFATSPGGICIIVGILLTTVGIVIYFKKDKEKTSDTTVTKENEQVKVEENKNAPTLAGTAQVEPIVGQPAPVEPVAIEPTMPTEAPLVVPSEGDGVKEVPVAQVAETINFNETTPAAPTPEVQIADLKPEALEMPTIAPTVAPVAPVVETIAPVAPVVEQHPTTTVYGGVSPEVLKPEVEPEKPREIYGGANPLENTAPIPTNTVNQAYAGSFTEVVTVPPVATPKPVVEPVTIPQVVTSTPVVEPVTIPQVATPTPIVEPTTIPQVVTQAVPEKKEEVEKLEF